MRALRQDAGGEGGEADVDGLADAGGDENIAHGGDAFARGFSANGFERSGNAVGGGVSVFAVAHGLRDRVDDVRRCLEIENVRVADIEGENFMSLLDDFIGDAGQVADGVADIFEARGWCDFAGLGEGHARILRAGCGKILTAEDTERAKKLLEK